MKNIKFLLGLLTIIVVMASCATVQGTSDETYDHNERTRQYGNRLYIDDPYYGTVVLERDPVTGRYYDVSNGYYGYRGLSSPYTGYYPYRRYGNYYRNNGNNRGNTQQPSREEVRKNREEARKKILGN